ncbi:MAG: transposase [Bradyrhizobium sp.]|jgi:transposase|uniref:transposase n=1 Tax=Bradyrhizobium sp. TaxID=376 RepID=UPI0012041053|nr:transposase [Bradyrhizobium sp.]THD49072.1 MAG: transposase [Bradyrhizobium sp.]
MNKQETLFPIPENILEPLLHEYKGKPRLVKACRDQYEIKSGILDDLIPKDHLARDVWRYVEGLDLSIVLRKIDAVEGNVGRPATDPRILLSIWIYATIKSIGSARLIAEYCVEHNAFKWICGGVNVNYHTISDFRSNHGDQLANLLIQTVAILSKNKIISLEKISQDGMRVRASAGSSSFRREGTLREHIVLATLLLNDLNEEAKKDPGYCKARLEAAERRSIEEKLKKIELAQNELKEIIAEKKRAQKENVKSLKT